MQAFQHANFFIVNQARTAPFFWHEPCVVTPDVWNDCESYPASLEGSREDVFWSPSGPSRSYSPCLMRGCLSPLPHRPPPYPPLRYRPMPPFPTHAPPVISAGSLNHEPGAPSIPTDCTMRKNSILTRSPKGCADPVAEVSDRCSVGKPPHYSVASSARSTVGRST